MKLILVAPRANQAVTVCNCFFVELLSVYWRKAKLWVKFRYRLTAKGIALKNSQTNDK